MFQPADRLARLREQGQPFFEAGRVPIDLDLRALIRAAKHHVQPVGPQPPRAAEDAQVLHVETDLFESEVGVGVVRDGKRAHGKVGGRVHGIDPLVKPGRKAVTQLTGDRVSEPCLGEDHDRLFENLEPPRHRGAQAKPYGNLEEEQRCLPGKERQSPVGTHDYWLVRQDRNGLHGSDLFVKVMPPEGGLRLLRPGNRLPPYASSPSLRGEGEHVPLVVDPLHPDAPRREPPRYALPHRDFYPVPDRRPGLVHSSP